MEKMKWDPIFSVGDPELDEQHKVMIGMINRMIEHPEATYTSEEISELLTQATKYAVEHFRTEEAHMEQMKYPSINVHKLEHKNFLVKIANASMLVMQRKEGPTDLLAYFKAWLKHHIMFSDMKYHHYNLKRRGLSLDEESLWVQSEKEADQDNTQ